MTTDPQGFNQTDAGNAERLVAACGSDLRYHHRHGKWLVWDNGSWQADESERLVVQALQTVRAIYHESEGVEDQVERKNLVRHALRSESEARLKAMISLAQADPRVAVRVDQLDADPWLFNVENGTIELKTGKLREHRREDLITKLAPVEYDPEATCPTWLAFVERIMGGNQDLVSFLQRAVGYSLTGITTEQVMLFLYGTGANGKSTLIETIRTMLGDYARQADFSTFLAKDNDSGARNDLARLVGARLVAASELEAGKRLSEVVIKQLTGSDKITARFLFKEHFEFAPTFKLWMAGNHKPTIRGTDDGIWRRIRLIPFNTVIPEAERDARLLDKLRAELPGILNWSITGCREWQQRGLGVPAEVREATASYRDEMDLLADFLEECCIVDPNVTAPATQLYERYKAWADEQGERTWPQRAFGMKLTDRGFERSRSTGGKHTWRGLGLVTHS